MRKSSLAAACFPILFACSSAALAGAGAELEPNPNVEVSYIPPRTAKYQSLHDRLKKRQVLEQLAIFLTPVKLPLKLKIQIDECGALTRVFTRSGGATICYEYLADIEKAAAAEAKGDTGKRKIYFAGAFIQSTLYRVALALLDVLEIPVWGRYTDAADRLAATVMLEMGTEVALISFAGADVYFKANKTGWKDTDYAAVRSPAAQRRYNYACMAIGLNEEFFKPVLKDAIKNLTKHRKPRCPGEYKQGSLAFFTLLWPHLDEEKAQRVKDMVFVIPSDIGG